MSILRGFGYVFCIVLILILPGCQRGNGVKVQGTVSVQGQLVDKGTIQFVAADGSTAEAGGIIQDGKFVVTVPPGEKIVRIRGSRVKGKKTVQAAPGAMIEVDDEVPLTSEKDHWTQSQLRETITTKTKRLEFNL